jgi:glycosyltransferase involved in cell wall biosynthesis
VKITLASLDHFHVLNQARLLQSEGHLDHYFSSRIREKIEGIESSLGTSCYPLHYGLRVVQRWPQFVGGNHFYLQLCRAFDYWLQPRFSRRTQLLAVLSGVGLQSFRAARRAGVVTVVECGSTHTDFQHEIVTAERLRNGLRDPLFPTAYRDRVRTEFEEADFIQIPSRFVGQTFLERGIPAPKLVYALYGVDAEKFKHRQRPLGNEPFRAICPSGVNLRKGARVLMEAWRKLGWKDAELHWIGGPSAETKHLFDRLPDSIKMHSWMNHDDLAALYRKCDAFVLPSFEEGFARVMLEAAASGLPLIVTPNTGAGDFFTSEGSEGWEIPVNDVEALCEALAQARTDRDETFRKGERAANRAKDFTWENYGNRVIENYRRILELQAIPGRHQSR